MTSRLDPDDAWLEASQDQVVGERKQLTNVAYRLLGSLADAEDVVQETYTRWYRMTPEERGAIARPGAWLTTVASRLCLDLLGSARARRERYVGEWIPEPLPDPIEWNSSPGDVVDPADRVTLDESTSMAFLIVLEAMTPAERVAFILHDVFRYPFADVAEIVGRTPAACRQLASSARRRIGTARPPTTPVERRAAVVREFKAAWEAQDLPALVELLAPGATAIADGGGRATAELRPIEGAERIAGVLLDIAARVPDLTLLERTVNGEPGLVSHKGGVTDSVMAFDVADGRILHIWVVRNPDKLKPWEESRRAVDDPDALL